MKSYRFFAVVLSVSVLLVLSGCQATEKASSDSGKATVVAGASQAKCSKPCDKSGDAAKAACCEKKKAEGKCPAAEGKKKAGKECPLTKKKCSATEKADKSKGCSKAEKTKSCSHKAEKKKSGCSGG
ncbi:MAG: hypothetical protein JSV03_05145 [Planctomycetota bacterium]|nr:MAG: hypothetical protein JSV03_05145 [Planctomycetota bacterium]